MGMCSGVRRAVRIALAEPRPADVAILGELVHNEYVTAELTRRGFKKGSPELDGDIPPTAKVLITAHGLGRPVIERLQQAGKQIVDTTCPFVRRIHDTVSAFSAQGRHVIVIGKPGHVEVKGITGALSHYDIVPEPSDATAYPWRQLGVVCQSTIPPGRADRVMAAVRALNPGKDIRFSRSICPATHERQAAVLALLDEVDALVVAGGANSNNTLELVELARSRGVPCFHIQTAADIRPEWFAAADTVGLTAGASTPDEVIEGVSQRLAAIQPAPLHAK